MKRISSIVALSLVLLLSAVGFVGAQALEIPKAAGPVTIDGDLSEFADAVKIALSSSVPAYLADATSTDGDKDISAVAYFMWDDKNLYVAARVVDDNWTNTQSTGNMWNGDSVEVWIGNSQFAFSLLSNASNPTMTRFTGNAATAGIEFKLVLTSEVGSHPDMELIATSVEGADGYVFEAAIPWSTVKGEAGATFKLAFGVNDADNGGTRSAQIYYPTTWQWNQTGSFADAVLVD